MADWGIVSQGPDQALPNELCCSDQLRLSVFDETVMVPTVEMA
jgi:hypothetical protein